MATLAQSVNESAARVVALDIPSGIDADSGEVAGEAVRADVTVTLGGVKQGLLRFPAAEYVGRLVARSIGLDDSALPYTTIDREMLSALVPRRPLDAHKYRFGRALIVAGTDHFLGAPVLCASAAARIGAGLVTVGSTRDVRLNGWRASARGDLHHGGRPPRCAAARRVRGEPQRDGHRAGTGPRRGRDPVGGNRAENASTRALCGHRRRCAGRPGRNPELANVGRFSCDPHTSRRRAGAANRRRALRRAALGPRRAGWLSNGAACFLRRGRLPAWHRQRVEVAVWPHANPALATGGTGDVLAGICGGLLAQGLTAWDAARFGVGVHALAAETVLARNGWRTLLASDLPDALPGVLAELSQVTPRR